LYPSGLCVISCEDFQQWIMATEMKILTASYTV
jgi:hypothetical protein